MQHMGTFKGNHNLSSLNRKDVSKVLLRGTRITLSNPFHKMFHTMQITNMFCQGRELGVRQLHNNTSIFFPCLHLVWTTHAVAGTQLFMAIPGIFRPASLLLKEEAGDWLRERVSILWPMWNSSARISSLAQEGTHRHTQTHTTHSPDSDEHFYNVL